LDTKLNAVQLVCIWALPILFAVTMHEAAHGWVAFKLGDDTAYRAGRISANPFKHIDPVGTILVPIVLLLTTSFLFGWAKPVPVDGDKLRHPKRDVALVALAGPLSNFAMAIIWMGLFRIGYSVIQHKIQWGVPFVLMSQAGVMINLFLMVLNLIPIPPLDGSRVISSLLPRPWDNYYNRLGMVGFAILLVLLVTNIIPKIMLPPVEMLYRMLQWLFQVPS
jgi:Zn-dependent protease